MDAVSSSLNFSFHVSDRLDIMGHPAVLEVFAGKKIGKIADEIFLCCFVK
jgi:hypothetical protein